MPITRDWSMSAPGMIDNLGESFYETGKAASRTEALDRAFQMMNTNRAGILDNRRFQQQSSLDERRLKFDKKMAEAQLALQRQVQQGQLSMQQAQLMMDPRYARYLIQMMDPTTPMSEYDFAKYWDAKRGITGAHYYY